MRLDCTLVSSVPPGIVALCKNFAKSRFAAPQVMAVWACNIGPFSYNVGCLQGGHHGIEGAERENSSSDYGLYP